ncbi:Aste57867_2696 [Aphanomyces stellatus]|uniref:D-3-phosphoglycerate dehydrogenase n=1 Tax=Aphanomyces stellatus TaxID=120398 RepID=A0A485K845_9STRA|nr:hypothetical protein As57867_002689 [Aphanomyces stellatus]VFT79889.1 Aste57867_2696 [Aphanomyces stellatus]
MMWARRTYVHGRRRFSAVSFKSHTPAFSNAAKHILCLDVGNPVCIDEFLQHGYHVDEISSQDLINSLGTLGPSLDKYEALLTDGHTKLPTHDILAHATRLKLIGIPGAQTSHVNLLAATNKGVMVQHIGTKLAGSSAVEAELVLSLLIHVARKIPQAIQSTKAGDGTRDAFLGHELLGKSIGIVGLNETGQRVGELASAMGLRVLAFDPNVSAEAAALVGVAKCDSLAELYGASDVLTFHVPLTGLTRKMFNAAALAQCKQGVTLISVGGMEGVIDDAILLPALTSGHVAGVAVDPSSPAAWPAVIDHHPAVLVASSAARATKTHEPARQYKLIAENMCAALDGRSFVGVVNGVFLPLTLLPEMKPFLALCESLGRFLDQVLPSGDVAHVTITTKGGRDIDITTPKARSALQGAVVKGLLAARAHGAPLSLLNASVVAMGQGIDVRLADELDGHATTQHLNNAVQVQVELQTGARCVVMGTVFGEEPRIVQVDEYNDFPAFKPHGTMLFFNNEDRPGAITGVLDQLARADINIASLGLARQADKPQAMGMLSLDSDPTDEIVARLKDLPGITNVRVAKL